MTLHFVLSRNIVATVLLGITLILTTAAHADQTLKPFELAYTDPGGNLSTDRQAVIEKLEVAGFQIVGEYTPYDDAVIIAVTNDDLKRAAASSNFGGYIAGQRVTLTNNNGTIEVAYTNPVYYGAAYRIEDTAALERAFQALEHALGANKAYGTGGKNLTAKDLREYHYMFSMEHFDDPSILAKYPSQKEANAAVEQGLAEGRGGVQKVYRIDIPGKDETVFGVALTKADDCSSDAYIMSHIDKDTPRSTGHLPYEMLVSDGEVYALYARFRIAISWPQLPILESDTGATFFSIMCAPSAIEEALIQAAGGKD